MFSSIPVFHPLDASSTSPAVRSKIVSRHCQMPLGDKIALVENHCFRGSYFFPLCTVPSLVIQDNKQEPLFQRDLAKSGRDTGL